jgi:hypothetical protein
MTTDSEKKVYFVNSFCCYILTLVLCVKNAAIVCMGDQRLMELIQDHIQWQALVLMWLNLQVLVPDRWLPCSRDAFDIGKCWYQWLCV